MAREQTTGFSESVFNNLGNLTYRMIDIGAQSLERERWLRPFDSIDAVLFTVAISSYDQMGIDLEYEGEVSCHGVTYMQDD
jgi:hypothetical protein